MIQIPLSQSGGADQFAKAVETYRKGVEAHMLGPAGKPAPRASEIIESLIRRVPQDGPVATRGPDKITVAEYQIVDDTPKTPDQEQAISVLRETING